MAEQRLTLQNLIEKNYKPETPLKTLEKAIIARLEKHKKEGKSRTFIYQSLFPNTILDTHVQEKIVAALISGNHILLFGPPGSGKTNLIKDILNLLPRRNYGVEGCPVHDSPFSLTDLKFSKQVSPCPICKARFSKLKHDRLAKFETKDIDPKKVPIEWFYMREGHGFARIQGSPEVFPDNLTGTINLHRLEEIGDPTSPLVIEPGKMMQANRGVLMIDEIGKLPHGTQNVLLQALQEATVTPAKSRESFPASFIAVTTSNLNDLDAINEPLNDRLTNIYVGYNSEHYKNRMIIDLHLKRMENNIFLPDIFIEAAVYLIEDWRRKGGDIYEFIEVGSNRTMIDIVTRTKAYSIMEGSNTLTVDAYKKGVMDAMMGRIRARGGESFFENKKLIEGFARENTPLSLDKAGRKYWCEFFAKELSSNTMLGKKTLKEIESVMASDRMLTTTLQSKVGYGRFRSFYKYVIKKERFRGPYKGKDLFRKVYYFMKAVDVFHCEEE